MNKPKMTNEEGQFVNFESINFNPANIEEARIAQDSKHVQQAQHALLNIIANRTKSKKEQKTKEFS